MIGRKRKREKEKGRECSGNHKEVEWMAGAENDRKSRL